MKKKLSFKELAIVSVMLFGMFFGAGNLIFPVHLGQLAGSNVWSAFIGFAITGVGLPLLGVAALGISKSNGLYELASKVGRGYGLFFTCLLYLTIGSCFAIPRCATVSYTVGVEPLIGGESPLALLIFTFLFFAVVLFFSLRPGKILTWIGKILTPVFLVFLFALIIISFISPDTAVSAVQPDEEYVTASFFNGFLEGYNTMDALASLAFGIVVVNVIRNLGLEDSDAVALSTAKAGIFSCLFMAVIYLGVCLMGTLSLGFTSVSENGGIALAEISEHYLGRGGQIFLACTVTLACLKTAIGLVTSICQAFAEMFTHSKGYKYWAIGFVAFAFIIANVGLSAIITYAVPVLMFLYPLAITLILLGLFGKLFNHDRKVYVSVTALTLVAALFDFFNALGVEVFNPIASKILPFYSLGLGWIAPALLGLIIGLALHFTVKNNKNAEA